MVEMTHLRPHTSSAFSSTCTEKKPKRLASVAGVAIDCREKSQVAETDLCHPYWCYRSPCLHHRSLPPARLTWWRSGIDR